MNRIHLDAYKAILWDFDGVIKDSVDIKIEAYLNLFENVDPRVHLKIAAHNLSCIGHSRLNKIPLYLEWSGLGATKENVQLYLDKYSQLVRNAVIESEWVPGVLEYLNKEYLNQKFALITATPQLEIVEILEELRIRKYFQIIYGAPVEKIEAIELIKNDWNIDDKSILFIGDSEGDLEAAVFHQLDFALRITNQNLSLQENFKGYQIKDFIYEKK